LMAHCRIGFSVSEIDSLILPPPWRQAWRSRTSPEYWKFGPLRHDTPHYRSILSNVPDSALLCWHGLPRRQICVFFSRKLSLVSIAVTRLFIPTFLYFSYPRIRSKSVWVTS